MFAKLPQEICKTKGMSDQCIFNVRQSTVLSRLLYAAPAWWGFARKEDIERLQSILNRARRWNYYSGPSISELCSQREKHLFNTVLTNPHHVLHQFLPPKKVCPYNLRGRGHNRVLPNKATSLVSKNFFCRLLYSYVT